jgi:leader peptidase (prepilin peptidase)/N-methyltransferase
MTITAFVTVVLAGLAVGSFVNVVIARMPHRRSIVRPGSACPGCGTPIAWHDNIPILSFVILRGRCRACGIAISWRYPVVEGVTAAAWVAAYLRFGLSRDLVVALPLLTALIAITAIDLEHQIIPDMITLPGILAGVVANMAADRVSWIASIIGIAVGGGIFFVIILVSRGGMGGGDMKFGAMLGAFLGWDVALLSVFIAVVLGGGLALLLLTLGKASRKDAIPFGPFLAAGGAVGLLCGPELMQWYLGSFGN